ncbi:nitric oxide-associated protein 1 isoform X2 [Megalopta genalis]|uniref:nitric oxide-associated protein 1 isoform X2 n=1 Tax=Megalopta genalis TaxID=115081 RepID=UPI003FD20CE5
MEYFPTSFMMHISKIRILSSRLNAHKLPCNAKLYHIEQKPFKQNVQNDEVDPKVLALREKLLYCDHLDLEYVKTGFKRRKQMQLQFLAREKAARTKTSFEDPVSSVILDREKKSSYGESDHGERLGTDNKSSSNFYMPYTRTSSYETIDLSNESIKEETSDRLNIKYKKLYEKYLEAKNSGIEYESKFDDIVKGEHDHSLPKGELWKVPSTWMTDFEQFNDTVADDEAFRSYGTPDPSSAVSSVPCGGCGALLHCKDPSIPGYLPSELFSRGDQEDLKRTVCQRCHFLKAYNAALHVKVSADDYPKLLKVIKKTKCAMVLIVDLTDFPCSIWPDLKSVMHPFTPVILVGNKVDLLPRDCPRFLDNLKDQLLNSFLEVTGISRKNVMHYTLASAKTGFGIESLINKLQRLWRNRGDVYLVGCTNVGKSTMFNALINSDYCKSQAVDLLQRATISPWPGTTLNLLKFPILNAQPEKVALRTQRLMQEQVYKVAETEYRVSKFRETRNIRYTMLEERVGRTFRKEPLEERDPFSEKSYKFMQRKPCFDETQPEYAQSRWCYDTPGTIQPDQILDLLTTDELSLTIPKQIISPRTFILRPKETMFLAGMGRLDYLEGDVYIRCTLFASMDLPLTVCLTEHADDLYEQLLTTRAFAVPVNDPERLERWPKLGSKEMKVTGINYKKSVADIVLSSIGWIAVTPHENEHATLRAWTPQARGIYLRTPALLSQSVNFRGIKKQSTPVYLLGRQVYVK